MKYARGLGQRPSDPDYCNAVSGPRPTNHKLIDALCFIGAIGLLSLIFILPRL